MGGPERASRDIGARVAMILGEVGAALALLTRVPVRGAVAAPSRAVWAFPLVGALIGGAGAVVVAAGAAAGMPPPVAAGWGVAASVLVGGGLHEDGLADVADGFGGGRTREGKLAIMRDSRIGSYGALALVLAMAIRVTAVAALVGRPGALVAAGALSRGALAIPLLLLGPARAEGLGAMMLGAGWRRWACLLLSVLLALLAGRMGAAAAAFGAALLVCALARRQIGGFTGDVLGACAVAAECAGLSALACT